MPSILGGGSSWVNHLLSTIDLFGKNINFTYKRQEKFKSAIGGCSTILVLILVLLYAITTLITVFAKNNTNTTASTTIQDLYKDTDPINLGLTDFTFAFSLSNFGYDDFVDTTKFTTFTISSTKFAEDGSIWATVTHDVELQKCGSDGFKFYDTDQLSAFNIEDYICASSTDFQVMGNSFNERESKFSIELELCTDTSAGCDPDLETNIQGADFDMLIVNNYFDVSNYDTPVRSYIDDQYSSSIIWEFSQRMDIYLSKDIVKLQDNPWSVSSSTKEEHEMIRVNRVQRQLNKQGSTGLKINFLKDASSISYERTVFTVLDALGVIGGFLGIVLAAFGVVVGVCTDRLFRYSIMSKLFQVDPLDNDDEEKAGEKELNKFTDEPLNDIHEEHKSREFMAKDLKAQHENSSHDGNVQDIQYDGGTEGKTLRDNDETKTNLSFKDLYQKLRNDGDSQDVAANKTKIYRHAAKSLLKRRAYNYTCGDYIYGLFCCLKMKKCSSKNPSSLYNRFKLYKKGEDKYFAELDVVNYANSLRKLQMLIGSIMDDSEITLTNYQHVNTIKMYGPDSSDNEIEKGADIPKFLPKRKNDNKVNHEGTIEKFLSKYAQEDWSAKDYKLLRGVYTKKPMTNSMLIDIGVDPDDYVRQPSSNDAPKKDGGPSIKSYASSVSKKDKDTIS